MAQLINEARRFQKLAGIIKEAQVGPEYIQAIEDAKAALTIVNRLSLDTMAREAIEGVLYNILPGIVDSEGNLMEESQINEGEKVGFIDVNTVKQMVNKPEVKKMAATLEDNPDVAKKLAAALSDPKAMAILSGESVSEDYKGKTLSVKERLARFLKYAGVGSAAGAILTPLVLITATATGPAILAMLAGGAIAGALVGALGGAAMTNKFKDALPIQEEEEESGDNIKDQISQVLAFGKK